MNSFNTFNRFILFLYSVLLAVVSVILLYGLVNDGIFADLLSPLTRIVTDRVWKYVYFGFLMLIFISAVYSIYSCITSGRLGKRVIKKTDIGVVDIGADAIESIALNSAKSAQVGIKSARVRVTSAKNEAINLSLNATIYSNVEIPASMNKVQEKVKKDVERYTGLHVENVTIKVSRVEAVVAKVDR